MQFMQVLQPGGWFLRGEKPRVFRPSSNLRTKMNIPLRTTLQ